MTSESSYVGVQSGEQVRRRFSARVDRRSRPLRSVETAPADTDVFTPAVEEPERRLPDEGPGERREWSPEFSPLRLKTMLRIADLATIVVGLACAELIARRYPNIHVNSSRDWLVSLAAVPALLVSANAAGLYIARANERLRDEIKNVVKAVALGMAATAAVAFGVGSENFTRAWLVVMFVSVVTLLTLERLVARHVFRRLRRSGRVGRRVIIVGADHDAAALAETLESTAELGYKVVGHIPGRPTRTPGLNYLGALDDIEMVAARLDVSSVMISVPSVPRAVVNQLSRDLTEIGLRVMLLTGLEDIDIERLRVQQLDRRAVLYLEPRIRTGWRRLAKRTFDLAFASLCLVISAPVIALAALAIRLESPGPVFFRQDRIGLDGRRFKMTKLRTMVCDAEERRGELLELNEADGPLFKIREDPRITRVGRFLRKSSIDEIPQFWNVLRGDMSVVGPRPALPHEVERWSPDLHDRLRVLPGITGLWQVSGRSDADFENYRRLDLYYVHNWSLAHDIRIVAKTVLVVFNGRGAS